LNALGLNQIYLDRTYAKRARIELNPVLIYRRYAW